MRQALRAATLLTAAMTVLLLLAGCGKSDAKLDHRFIGKWQTYAIDLQRRMEFFKDGTVVVREGNEPGVSGKWAILEDGRLKINFTVLGTDHCILASYEFNKDNPRDVTMHENGLIIHYMGY